MADVTAGNLKLGENADGPDAEPFRLVKGAVDMPGVPGAVTIPLCLRGTLPGRVLSWLPGENEDMRGEGWVAARWPIGAIRY